MPSKSSGRSHSSRMLGIALSQKCALAKFRDDRGNFCLVSDHLDVARHCRSLAGTDALAALSSPAVFSTRMLPRKRVELAARAVVDRVLARPGSSMNSQICIHGQVEAAMALRW